jgi:undecaprenyl-diphosphatase
LERQNRTLILGFFAAAAALLVFAWLANQVVLGATINFDAAVRDGVHQWASPPLTYIMRGFTQLGSPAFLFCAGVVAVWRLTAAGRKRAALVFVIAAFGGEALDQVLKLAFHRPRPEVFFGLSEPFGYSFPSGHAITSACFYGSLAALLAPRAGTTARRALLWAWAAFMALAIGLSRIYLGVHYPSDVVAGYAAAVVWVATVRAGYWAWLRRLQRAPAR